MSKIAPSVSVIIPTYNSAEFLSDAIDSALAQTYGDMEIIVINDGSTDDTRDVLEKYAGHIIYLEQKNGGPAKARNKGIGFAKGEYIAFLDADDIWLPSKLEEQMSTLASHPDAALVYSRMINFDQAFEKPSFLWPKTVYSGHIFDELLVEDCILLSSVVVKASVLREVSGFDEGLLTAEDWNFYLKVAKRHEIVGIDKAFVKRRMHTSNLSERVDVNIGTLDSLDRLIDMFPDIAPGNYPQMRRAYLQRGMDLAQNYFYRSQYARCHQTCGKVRLVSGHEKVIFTYWFITLLPPFVVDVLRKAKKLVNQTRTGRKGAGNVEG